MRKVIFRADGNAQIGLSHIIRCLALSEILQNEFSMRFALAELTPEVLSLLNNTKLTFIPLLGPNSETAFLDHIKSDEIAVLDGYSFTQAFQQSVRARAKKLVFTDDLVSGHQVADVVINHSGGVSKNDYEAESYTQFCLGPHYAVLPPEFLRTDGFGLPSVNGPVFVSLGGADPKNMSLTVLKAIQQVDDMLPVQLVLEPFHPNRPAIEAFQTQLPNLTVLQNLTANQIVSELQQCSLAITACSTIAYEVCAINRPLIAVATADSQARLAQFLSDEKLALSVNFPTLLSRLSPSLGLDTALRLAIQSFQFSPEAVADTLMNQRRYFDGRSPERFRALFNSLSA